jgi:2-methylcitrate dehydratase PrpD
LVNEQNIKAEDVKEIKLFSDEGGYHSLCTPHEVKVKPRTQVDTQFSIPWGVATAVAKGRATIEHFTEAAIKSRDVLEVASKISVEMDHSLDRADKIPPGKLEIRMKNGQPSRSRWMILSGVLKDPCRLMIVQRNSGIVHPTL